MSEDVEVGYLWKIDLNAQAIMESGIRIKADEWILFYAIQAMFPVTWSRQITENGRTYVMVQTKFIKSQLAPFPEIAEASNTTIWRKIKALEEVGLIVGHPDNTEKAKRYVAMGVNANQFLNVPVPKMKQTYCKNEIAPISELKHNNIDNNNSNKNSIPHTPLDGVSPETPVDGDEFLEKKKRTTSKKRITDKEAEEFYIDQLKDFPPTPKDLAPGPEVARKDMYRLLVRWMFKGDVGMRDGFKGTVLNMGSQLKYEDYCALMDASSLNDYQIRQYLVRMHNYEKRHDNKSIYLTMLNWHREDVKHGRIPPAKPVVNGTNGQPIQAVARAIKHGPHGD